MISAPFGMWQAIKPGRARVSRPWRYACFSAWLAWRTSRCSCGGRKTGVGSRCGQPREIVVAPRIAGYCAGLTSMIDGGERYFDVFFTSLSISRHVINST